MKFISVFVFFFLTLSSLAQSDWTPVYSDNNLKVKIKEADCNPDGAHLQKWVLIKVENNSSDTKLVEWDLELYNQDQKCITCNGSNEHHRSFKIAPHETLEGKCSLDTQYQLRVIERFLDIKTVKEVHEVKLANIKATVLN